MTNQCCRLMTIDAHRMVPIDKGLGGCWFYWLLRNLRFMNGQWQSWWIRSLISNNWWIAISNYRCRVFADHHHYPVLFHHSGERMTRMTNDACWWLMMQWQLTMINSLQLGSTVWTCCNSWQPGHCHLAFESFPDVISFRLFLVVMVFVISRTHGCDLPLVVLYPIRGTHGTLRNYGTYGSWWYLYN